MSTFLAMSVSGGALILVIAVLRALFAQRLPRRLLCALWAAALLRLLLPVFPPSPLSLFPAMESGGEEALPAAVAVSTAAPQTVVSAVAPDAQVAASEAAPAATRATTMPQTAPAPQAVASTNAESSAPPVWPIVHGSVAALLLILLAVLYARGLRRFRASAPCEDGFARQWLARHPLRRPLRLRLCAAIDAPLTYGLLRPVILLPAGFNLSDREALDCVLRHELAHVRRFDALFKAALAVTACLHWFNPLVWVMLALANRDLELACDEQALRAAARERRRAYARAHPRTARRPRDHLPHAPARGSLCRLRALRPQIRRRRPPPRLVGRALLHGHGPLRRLRPGAYLQNFHGNTDVFAIRDEYGTLIGLNWSFPGLDIYDACTQVIARAYAAEGLPTPTPLPERTPEPTPTAAFLAPLPEELAAYAPYGLTANEDGTLTYLGSSVRFFIDEAAGVELRWDTGGAGVCAVPEDANAAYNWNGRDELSTATGTVPVTLYEPYGLGMYDGRLYYGAEGVRSFLDEALGVEEYSHLPTATLDLRALRDANGELTGLRVATAAESAAIAGDLYEYEAPPQQGGPLGSVEAAEDWY